MKKILNLSNHIFTEDQLNELEQMGYKAIELQQEDKQMWGQLNPQDYKAVCNKILSKYRVNAYHLAGFPAAVVYVCNQKENKCYYAFSERCSVDETQPDGSVVKKNIFKHKGFYLY